MIARQPAARQRLTCLEDERLDLGPPHADDVRDLLVGVVAHLEQDQRRTLVVGQSTDLVDHVAKILSALNLVRQIHAPVLQVVLPRLGVVAGADLGQASVARDRVQPGPQHDLIRALAHRPVGGHQSQLKRILGRFAAAEHVRAEREQATRVAVVDLFERSLNPSADRHHQLLIGLIRERPRRRVMSLL